MPPLWLALAAMLSGEIFGDLRSGETYLTDVPVSLVCGAHVVEGRTDRQGSFRLRSPVSGKCRFQVTWKEQTAATDIVVFERATRYRFVIEAHDGTLTLKRV
jgi:hypothetical protein